MKARDRVGGDARDRGGRSWWGRRVPVLRAHARDEGERARHARWGESAPRHARPVLCGRRGREAIGGARHVGDGVVVGVMRRG